MQQFRLNVSLEKHKKSIGLLLSTDSTPSVREDPPGTPTLSLAGSDQVPRVPRVTLPLPGDSPGSPGKGLLT